MKNQLKTESNCIASKVQYIPPILVIERKLLDAMDSTNIAAIKRLENFIDGELSKENMVQAYSDIREIFKEAIPKLDKYLSGTHSVSSGYEAIRFETLANQLELMEKFCELGNKIKYIG